MLKMLIKSTNQLIVVDYVLNGYTLMKTKDTNSVGDDLDPTYLSVKVLESSVK